MKWLHFKHSEGCFSSEMDAITQRDVFPVNWIQALRGMFFPCCRMVGGGDALLEQLKPAANRTVPPPEVSSNYSKFGEQLRMVRS